MADHLRVVIYGKAGCGKCEAAKAKMGLLQMDYEYRDLEETLALHDGWREDGSVDVAAADADMDTLPLIRVNGEVLDYPGAMRRLMELFETRKVEE